ncbi:hypothetical protein GW916_01285 [bacterium]|nr:hypothetical protein [bacterium]
MRSQEREKNRQAIEKFKENWEAIPREEREKLFRGMFPHYKKKGKNG